ncbi:MAG: ABC transporter ATP-binding protein [marine bacterium B5-7]|nr:MAG: ABC transporter ATP-binding protein [marine bacterium B5-7]
MDTNIVDMNQGRPILKITSLASHYGRIQALFDVDIEVFEGELVALVGANGAGKTTLLRTISGLQRVSSGSIHYRGDDIGSVPAEQRVRLGISQVPEGRQVFGPMSVEDNLRLGAYTRPPEELRDSLEQMFDMFPALREMRSLAAGTLSGGQQQMLAIARALMAKPKLLLLDEPSMGLAPLLVAEVFNTITMLKDQQMTILLVEQNAQKALSIADRGYVIETGRIVLTDRGSTLLDNKEVQTAYLGV